jgi:hypothetical protein
MNQHDFISKLMEIEEQANLLAADSAPLLRTRCQHIALLARVLRGRLEGGLLVLSRFDPGKDGKLPA